MLIRECLNIIIDIDFLNSTFTKLFFFYFWPLLRLLFILILTYFTSICTGLTFLNVPVSNTRLASQCTACCLQSKASNYLANCCTQSQTLLADATYARAVSITPLYHVTGSLALVVEPSLLQARRSGTLPESLQDPVSQQQQFQATT